MSAAVNESPLTVRPLKVINPGERAMGYKGRHGKLKFTVLIPVF